MGWYSSMIEFFDRKVHVGIGDKAEVPCYLQCHSFVRCRHTLAHGLSVPDTLDGSLSAPSGTA